MDNFADRIPIFSQSPYRVFYRIMGGTIIERKRVENISENAVAVHSIPAETVMHFAEERGIHFFQPSEIACESLTFFVSFDFL